MALGGKFIRLTDQNGGVFYTQPAHWLAFETTSGQGADKKPLELVNIRFADGSMRKVREKLDEVAKQVEKIAV